MTSETKHVVKKANTDAIAESLDNTAPFKIIIASIDEKKKKEKTLINYINCTVKRRHHPGTFCGFSDFIFPAQPRNAFTEDWDGGLTSGFFEELSLKSLMPFMITAPQNMEKSDPLVDTLRQRYNWGHKWGLFKRAYSGSKKENYKWFGDVLYCSKIFTEMAEHLVNKPDPHFDEAYNWYYAGKGNMAVNTFDDLNYLIYSVFNCLYVSPFCKEKLSIDYAKTATYECTEGMNIMETTISQDIIALRTKCKIIIVKLLICNETIRLERLKEIDSELPFTSITFDEYHKNILYVTTLDYQLTIVNLDRMTGCKKKLRGKFKRLTDNWSSVVGSERGYYMHVTRKALTLYDKRTNDPFQRWKSFGYVSDIQSCGKVSAVKYSERKPLLYVGTDHYLFLMDMRCSKTKADNIKPVQRWTHGMMSTPTYLDIFEYDQDRKKEMVCLSSQWFEDMCFVSNYSDRLTRVGEISGLALPYRPPSIMETFNEAQRKELCCNLYKPIQHRLCSSISGLSVTEQRDNYSILMQNSLGDISCHTLYPEHMLAFIEDNSAERLHEWSMDYDEEKKPFEVTHIIDIKPFLNKLCQVPDDYILGRNTVIKPRIKFNENEIYESYSRQELDPEFLEIWKEKEDSFL